LFPLSLVKKAGLTELPLSAINGTSHHQSLPGKARLQEKREEEEEEVKAPAEKEGVERHLTTS